MIRCKLCSLEPANLKIVDDALRAFQAGRITLLEVAQSTGLPKTNLFRHSRHLSTAPAQADPSRPVVSQSTVLPPASPPTKEELLSRLESVWRKVVSGVSESKETGDLHVRAGLLREARRTLELQGDWTGNFPRKIVGNAGDSCMVTLIVPQRQPGAQEPKKAVEIALPRRLR